jgi:hypothetical protein
MYTWTVKSNHNVIKLLGDALSSDILSEESLKILESHISSLTQMSESFRNLVLCLIGSYKKNKTKLLKQAINEVIAGLDYCYNNQLSGIMHNLKDIGFKNESVIPAIMYLKKWYEYAIAHKRYTQGNMWFMFRVLVMDVFTFMHILSSPSDSECIFYGGNKHIETVEKLLHLLGAESVPVPEMIDSLAQNRKLMTVRACKMKEKIVIFLGENHNQTVTSFGSEFIDMLKSQCNANKRMRVVFIEKHISNDKDKMQRMLTCNMQHMAIHRMRCDSFLDTHKCENMKVVNTDNRHFDLGFWRYEIFMGWKDSEDFRKCAIQFHRECLESLKLIVQELKTSMSPESWKNMKYFETKLDGMFHKNNTELSNEKLASSLMLYS